jgi:RimJ/RimL family protein N-acetyltransferase
MNLPELVHTARLVLRRPKSADADAIFAAYARDPEVSRYTTWRPHADIEETRTYLASCNDAWERGSARTYVITFPGSAAIGALELRPGIPHPHSVSVGYVLARSRWGRGYMSEALTVVVDELITQGDVFRIWAICDVENRPSARVMEKAGLRYEALLRRWVIHPNISPDPRDCLSYARVK